MSRNPTRKDCTVEDKIAEEKVEAFVDAVQASWPVHRDKLEYIRQAVMQNQEMQTVISYVINGWPVSNTIPTHLKKILEVRGSLSVMDGLLVCDSRIVIRQELRSEMLTRLHESHMGYNKCIANAAKCIWWPGITSDIKHMVKNCEQCVQNQPAQRSEPLRPTALPSRPWEKIGADLFELDSKMYLVVIDYYSRWIEIRQLQ